MQLFFFLEKSTLNEQRLEEPFKDKYQKISILKKLLQEREYSYSNSNTFFTIART